MPVLVPAGKQQQSAYMSGLLSLKGLQTKKVTQAEPSPSHMTAGCSAAIAQDASVHSKTLKNNLDVWNARECTLSAR